MKDVSIQVYEGDMIGILGRSGSGKTTLLNILGLLDHADSGKYEFKDRLINTDDENLVSRLRRDNIGFVIQNYALMNQKSIFYNISLPLLCKKTNKKEIKYLVEEMASKVSISDLLNKYPYEISGGECQRVSIARALVRKPDIILADEPTGALDEATEQDILSIFKELNKKGVTMLIVTHNQAVVDICRTYFTISDGKITLHN